MKAVLVFDVEEDIFKEIEKTSDLDIWLEWNHDTMHVPKEKRIKNYSLKPLPKKDIYDPKNWATIGFEDGITLGHYLNRARNEVIDEILGETE